MHLHLHARTTHPPTALLTYLYAASQQILGVVPSPLARRPDTHNTTTPAILTHPRWTNYVTASPGDYRQMEHTAHLYAHRSLRYTTSNGYWV
jgi:hypothetical protein